MRIQSLVREDPHEEEMATHSSIIAWRIPWTEEPGSLQSMGCKCWTQLKRHSMHASRSINKPDLGNKKKTGLM